MSTLSTVCAIVAVACISVMALAFYKETHDKKE